MSVENEPTQPQQQNPNHPQNANRDVRSSSRFLRLLSRIPGALLLLALGLAFGFAFLESFEPGNGLVWKLLFGALTSACLVGAFALLWCAIKDARHRVLMDRTNLGLKSWLWGALTLVLAVDGSKCIAGTPDPLLPAGEQALIGSYKLDNVLLAPGKLVVLPNGNPLFQDMGDSPEQAARKGLLNASQLAVLKRQDSTLTILTNHTFVLSNLPSTDLTRTFTVRGTWSINVYHAFDTYGYRLSLNCAEYHGPALHVRFIGADKPNPPILELFSGPGKQDPVMFRFANTNSNAAP